MKSKVIIATHGYLADGYKNTLKTLTDDVSDLVTVNAYTDECENIDQAIESLICEYSKQYRLIFLTDMMYGSVNQALMREMQRHEIIVITGINLPLVLEIYMKRNNDDVSLEKWDRMVEKGRMELKLVNSEIKRINNSSQEADEKL